LALIEVGGFRSLNFIYTSHSYRIHCEIWLKAFSETLVAAMARFQAQPSPKVLSQRVDITYLPHVVVFYGRTGSGNSKRTRLEQARCGAGNKDGVHAAVSAHNLNVAEINIPAPGFRRAVGMEADLAESLPGIGREIHPSEMGNASNGIRVNRLVVLIHCQTIVSASDPFATGEAYLNAGDASRILRLVEVQNVAAANDIAVDGAGLNREVCDLPATSCTVGAEDVYSIILNGKRQTIAYLAPQM
jgi:hypothetical protein